MTKPKADIINPSDKLGLKPKVCLRVDTESGVIFPRPKGRGITSTSLSVLRRSVLSLPKENAAECIKIRRRWGRNPQTKIKQSAKCYLRRKEKAKTKRAIQNENNSHS